MTTNIEEDSEVTSNRINYVYYTLHYATLHVIFVGE